MFKHLLTLIWNKRKQNFLLMTEIFVSFLILFGIFSMLVNQFKNYIKPMGFNPDNVWVINFNSTYHTNNNDSLVRFYQNIEQALRAMPEIQEVTYTSFYLPFSGGVAETGLTYKDHNYFHIGAFQGEASYQQVMQLKVVEGRWFNKEDALFKTTPIVIDETLKKDLFGKETAIGKKLSAGKIIGVVQDPKMASDYSALGRGLFNRIDTGNYRDLGHMLVRVNASANTAFEGRLYDFVSRAIPNGNVNIEHLNDRRKVVNRQYTIPMIIAVIIGSFLIINVSLGIFGVLWYNINKRRAELGLRRAVGASGKSISGQLAAEALILATLGLIVGVFFAIQVPLLNLFNLDKGIYFAAILLSILFIYGLVFICSVYPGRQAAAIYPAAALHEN